MHGEAFHEQPFYECVTCSLTLENGTGICRACKNSCHAGHEVGFVGRIKAYCDCGRGGCALARAGGTAAALEAQATSDEEEGGDEFVDPRLARNYGDKAYWDERYRSNRQSDAADEWLVGYSDIAHVVAPQLEALPRRRPRLLMLGCGDSEFSADLYDAGFPDITNVDISEVCIETMRRKEGRRRPKMRWEVADCTDLSRFAPGSFDAVIDKTLFDALCCSSDAVALVPRMLEGVQRVLRRGGCYIIVSFSLESAKASFEQAVLSEALFASFEPRVPTVAMTVDAAEDDCDARDQVMATRAGGESAAAVGEAAAVGQEGQGETKPVDFHVFCLQPRAKAAGAQ